MYDVKHGCRKNGFWIGCHRKAWDARAPLIANIAVELWLRAAKNNLQMGAAYRPGRADRSGSVAAEPLEKRSTWSAWAPYWHGRRRRRGMRRHAGTTSRTRRRARTPGAQTLQTLRRYDHLCSLKTTSNQKTVISIF